MPGKILNDEMKTVCCSMNKITTQNTCSIEYTVENLKNDYFIRIKNIISQNVVL